MKSIIRATLFIILVHLTLTKCNILTTPTSSSSPSSTSTTPSPSRTYASEEKLRQSIVNYAKRYKGSKYKSAGRSPKGFDCSGFTYYVMKNFSIELSPVSRYQEKEGQKIPFSEAQKGDLLFFRRTASGEVFHVALIVDHTDSGYEVIHSTSRGVVVENIMENSFWKSKIITARNVIE